MDVVTQPLPEDIDLAYFNHASRDQQVQVLHENERIVLENLHPAHSRIATSLSGARPRATVERVGGTPQPVVMRCDTLWIDTDRSIATLTWRAQVPLEHPQERGRVVVMMDQPGQNVAWAGAALGRSQNSSSRAHKRRWHGDAGRTASVGSRGRRGEPARGDDDRTGGSARECCAPLCAIRPRCVGASRRRARGQAQGGIALWGGAAGRIRAATTKFESIVHRLGESRSDGCGSAAAAATPPAVVSWGHYRAAAAAVAPAPAPAASSACHEYGRRAISRSPVLKGAAQASVG